MRTEFWLKSFIFNYILTKIVLMYLGVDFRCCFFTTQLLKILWYWDLGFWGYNIKDSVLQNDKVKTAMSNEVLCPIIIHLHLTSNTEASLLHRHAGFHNCNNLESCQTAIVLQNKQLWITLNTTAEPPACKLSNLRQNGELNIMGWWPESAEME